MTRDAKSRASWWTSRDIAPGEKVETIELDDYAASETGGMAMTHQGMPVLLKDMKLEESTCENKHFENRRKTVTKMMWTMMKMVLRVDEAKVDES